MTLPPAPAIPQSQATDVAIQVLRSYSPWKVFYIRSLKRVRWTTLPRGGVHEVYETLVTAIAGARRYIYLEDQYFYEMPGGSRRFSLYKPLRQAASRGVRLILVGSGRKDPSDGGGSIRLQRRVTGDLERRILRRLPKAKRRNLIMHRIEGLTVHTKLVLVDDVFACIGSANFFSRSMVGTDSEMSCAMVTTGNAVGDLRVRLWAEHLRTPVDDRLRPQLENLDVAMGIWRSEWLPPRGTGPVRGQPMTGTAAFFDLDHVLIPGSSLFLLARDLRSHDVYRAKDLARLAAQRPKIRLARESDKDLESMRQQSLSSIAGRTRSEVQAWGRQLANYEVLPRVYPDIAKIIAAHCAAGDRTYLVTATPAELAEPVAVALDMTAAIGSVAEIDADSRYTGRRVGDLLRGPAGARVIADLADRTDTDLRRCHVYSNTIDDEHLLRSVGHPHAVNPDAKLWKIAVRHGWAVHELRPLRRQILVGTPPFVPVGAVVGIGYAIGRARARRG